MYRQTVVDKNCFCTSKDFTEIWNWDFLKRLPFKLSTKLYSEKSDYVSLTWVLDDNSPVFVACYLMRKYQAFIYKCKQEVPYTQVYTGRKLYKTTTMAIVFINQNSLTGGNWQKWKKSIPDMSPSIKFIGMKQLVSKVANILEKLQNLWKWEIWGNIVKIWYFVNNFLIEARI